MISLAVNPLNGNTIYAGSASGLAASPAWTRPVSGRSVAGAGDVNGDGYSDVIVGGYGGVVIYLGSAGGPSLVADWVVNLSDQTDANYGVSVAGAGDVNGDGFDDFIVGASMFDNQQVNEGRAFFYNGSAGVPDVYPEWTAESDQTGALFGASVSGAGDVNADGYADVIVGAYQYNNKGRAYVYLGSPIGLALTPTWTADGDQATAFFGGSVASAGDVNGSGYSAVIVGASQYHNPEDLEGRAYLYQTDVVGVPVVSGATARPSLAALPNPSRAGTELRYVLPASGRVRLTIHDIAGRAVTVLADAVEEAGPHTARWDGRGERNGRVPSGVYVARLEFAGRVETRRMVLAR